MINRDMNTVEVLTYSSTPDAYGQINQSTPTSRNTQMMIKWYSQNGVDDIRYQEVTDIGITKDSAITDNNKIRLGNQLWDVLQVIPSSRYNQILLRRV